MRCGDSGLYWGRLAKLEREIGNVAADAGLKAFRYLSFAPVAFASRPIPAPDARDAAPQQDMAPSPPEVTLQAETVPALEPAALPTAPPPPEVDMAPLVMAPPVPVASVPALTAAAPRGSDPGLFSPTPGMPSFTTVTEAVSRPAFVVPAPEMPARMLPEPAPLAPTAPAPAGLAPTLSGAARLRRLAELQPGGVPRPAPASTGSGSGTGTGNGNGTGNSTGIGNGIGAGRRFALLQDVRSDLAGRPDHRAMAPAPAREPPA